MISHPGSAIRGLKRRLQWTSTSQQNAKEAAPVTRIHSDDDKAISV